MRRALLLPLPLLWACASASGPAQGPASGPADGPHAHGDHGHGDHGRHMEHAFDDPEAWAKRFDEKFPELVEFVPH